MNAEYETAIIKIIENEEKSYSQQCIGVLIRRWNQTSIFIFVLLLQKFTRNKRFCEQDILQNLKHFLGKYIH